MPGLPPPLPRARSSPPPLPGESLLNIEELARFENLLVFARSIVEGFFAGRHKSPYRGSAAEFADYKEYVAGDDLARLDWRVYGRTRRLFVRQFEEETDMVVYVLVDTSNSMRYAGAQRPSKYQLAAKIAAALTYLMLAQGDKTALGLFAEKVTSYIPPGGTRRHLHQVITTLERVKPARGTGLATAVEDCAQLIKKRGRLVILSDFLDDTNALFDSLARFVHRKFEILLLQIVDPDELHLPPLNAANFIDLETGDAVQIDPEEIRAEYRARMAEITAALAREADVRQIQYRLIDTQRPYLDALEAYLGFRGKNEYSR
jgi:uncharacterized protein (DUF58 family)